jgi:hypothetical protein
MKPEQRKIVASFVGITVLILLCAALISLVLWGVLVVPIQAAIERWGWLVVIRATLHITIGALGTLIPINIVSNWYLGKSWKGTK